MIIVRSEGHVELSVQTVAQEGIHFAMAFVNTNVNVILLSRNFVLLRGNTQMVFIEKK